MHKHRRGAACPRISNAQCTCTRLAQGLMQFSFGLLLCRLFAGGGASPDEIWEIMPKCALFLCCAIIKSNVFMLKFCVLIGPLRRAPPHGMRRTQARASASVDNSLCGHNKIEGENNIYENKERKWILINKLDAQ